MPCHTVPSSQAFVVATLGGMGWGMHPLALIREHLDCGRLVALEPDGMLDVPLYWQQARIASSLMNELSQAVVSAARLGLVQP